MTTTAPATGTARASWVRRYRPALVVAAAFVAAVVFAVIGGSGDTHSGLADPGNADPEGARALARVLDHEGVEVTVVRSAEDFDATTTNADTTVVVTSTENLGDSTARRLQEHAGDAQVILVEPQLGAAGLFGLDDGDSLLDETSVSGNCPDRRFTDLRISIEGGTAYPASSSACFGTDAGAVLVSPTPLITVLGSADLISNEHITRAENAAVALRLFGQHERLVWYVPDVADLGGADGVSIGSLLPRWLRPGLVLGSVAMLSVLWWRGRRLGRLVSEPLPVTVTAIETTRSRGRLYQKVDDRAHAAEALRRAARRQIADQLSLPRAAAADAAGLIRDVQPYTALDEPTLTALLAPGRPPASDHDLIHLANDLADLMREVRRS
jgi:hypothetical protein